jgi:hypothetical protein
MAKIEVCLQYTIFRDRPVVVRGARSQTPELRR